MTRIEFVASLDKDVRKRFIANCVDCNTSVDFIDQWMVKEMGDNGIKGAFVWANTREGHVYWGRVNANIKK